MELNQNLADFFPNNKTGSGGSTPTATPPDSSGGLSLDLADFFPKQPKQNATAPTGNVAPPANAEEFVRNVAPAAKRVAERLNVPVEAVIGQWGLETGWGKSVIPGTNNLGNIKDFSGRGVAATDNMTGSRDKYREYESTDHFADDFSSLLSNQRYRNAVGTKDAQSYFTGLKQGGYAEDPNYISSGMRAAKMAGDLLMRVVGVSDAKAAETESKKVELPDLGKAKPWAEIAKNPEYQALDDATKAQAKAAYFDHWVAPHAGGRAAQMRQQFLDMQDPTPSMMEKAGALVDRGLDAVKSVLPGADGTEAPLTQEEIDAASKPALAGDVRGRKVRKPEANTLPGSVMNNLPEQERLATDSLAPVRPEVRAAFNAQWDAAAPEQRAAMAQQEGVFGQLARERTGRFDRQDALVKDLPNDSAARGFDPRVEARRQALIAKGEDPRFAERAAMEGARAGVVPGKEVDFIQNQYGKMSKSDFDSETSQFFKDQIGANNPLVRGTAKAALGTGKAVLGINQFLADAMGADEYSAFLKKGNDWARNKEGAIGDKGTFLERNLEGAINSIGQQLPWMIAGAATGAAAIPLAAMGMQSFGQEYTDGRAQGQDVQQAATRASIFAAFEVLGEKFGLGSQLKALRGAAQGMPNDQIIKLLGDALEKEVPGELFTTTGQFAADKWMPKGYALNPNATVDDFVKQVADTIAQTVMQSAVMGAGTTGVSTARRFMSEKGYGEGIANADAENAKTQAIQKWESLPKGGRVEPTVGVIPENLTEDGRIEPTMGGQPAAPAAAAEPSPIDVHPTSQTADGIVTELANQAGVPLDTVLPTQQTQQQTTAPESFSDDDVLSFADRRYEQLLNKRDGQGFGDEAVPGEGLTEQESQELEALRNAGDNSSELRKLYGFDQDTSTGIQSDAAANQKFAQEPAPVAGQAEQPVAGQQFPDATEPGLVAAQSQENQNAQSNGQTEVNGITPSPSPVSNDGQPGGAAAQQEPAAQAPAAQDNGGNDERSANEQNGTVQTEGSVNSPSKDSIRDINGAWTDPRSAIKSFVDAGYNKITTNKQGWVELTKPGEIPVAFRSTQAEMVQEIVNGSKPRTEKEARAQKDYSEKWFASDAKAQGFIDKQGIGATHAVKQDGNKFLIQPKEAANGTQAPEAKQAEAQGSQAPAAGAVTPPKGGAFPMLEALPYVVPKAFVQQYADELIKHHSQSVDRLAQRGGLAPAELLAAIRPEMREQINRLPLEKTTEMLGKLIEEFNGVQQPAAKLVTPQVPNEAGTKYVIPSFATGQQTKAKTEKEARAQREATPVVRDATTREIAAALDADPMLDLRKEPTGWKKVPLPNGYGVILVSTDGKKSITFESANKKSGTEGMRASALAQAYAIDNPYTAPESNVPAGDLVITPILKPKTEKEAKATKAKAEPVNEEKKLVMAVTDVTSKRGTVGDFIEKYGKAAFTRATELGMLDNNIDRLDSRLFGTNKLVYELQQKYYDGKNGKLTLKKDSPAEQKDTRLTEPTIARRANPGGLNDRSFVARAFIKANDVGVEGVGATESEALANLSKDADEYLERQASEKKVDLTLSPLTKAMNDLMEMKAKAESQGRVQDDRLLTKIRQQEKVVAELQAEKPAVSANTVFTEDAAAKARALLKSKLGQINSGIDPEVLQAGITLAGYHIEKGARTFSAYAKAMIEDLGDAVKPYLKSWYMGVKFDPRAAAFTDMDTSAAVEAANVDQVESAAQPVEKTATPVGQVDLSTPEGKFKVAQSVADHLIGDGSFATIVEARKYISQITGKDIKPATELAKQADEAIETGVVLAAREIIAAGRKQGRSPQIIYDRLLGLYNRQPNLAVRSSTSMRDQAYSTPVPLAYVASELAGITADSKVYEPTAGNGMLVIGSAAKNTVVNELNPKRGEMLKRVLSGADVQSNNAATWSPDQKFDSVIENPPFGATKDANGDTIIYEVKPTFGTREVDHAIVYKSLETMKDDGRAVLIVGGVQAEGEEARREDYRGKNKRTFYFNLYNDYNVVDHFSVDGSLYSKQGASYPVDVIVIEGRGKSSRALPASDLPQIVGSYDELKEKLNGTRSVGTEGVQRPDRTDSSQDQAGAGDGTGVARSPVGSRERAGDQGTGKPADGVQGTRRAGDREPESSGAIASPAQSGADAGIGSKSDRRQSVSSDSGRAKPGSQGRTATDSERLGGASVVDGERVGSGLTDRRGQEQETETQVAYKPHSAASSVGTLVPKAMRDAIDTSIQKIEDEVGSIDEYVSGALDLPIKTVKENFSAEQIDALALSIKNAQEGRGFIIGDQTGIGKGRVVAAMIRYALVNGKTPIFVTEKPNLYSDMIRDMDDIGMTKELALDTKSPKIFVTNGSESIPYTLLRTVKGEVTETNLTLKSPKSGKALDEMMRGMIAGSSLGDYKVIFTTYSQLQTVKGKATERQNFVSHFGENNYMIFDESHNAGGGGETQARSKEQRESQKEGGSLSTGRAAFVRNLVGKAFGTFFSSATYAKRPDVMDLYSSTNMKLAVDKPSQLGEAIKLGGVPMQQVVANMLTTDGQYIRRERTFAGVSYDTQETKVDKPTAENMANAMRSILAFSRAKETVVKSIQKEMDKEGAMVKAMGGESSTIQGANFGSIMHNLIDQMLLSLKVQDSVKHAIARLKAGEKVVMTVSNTMGSFIKDYAEEMGINTGDPVALSFADLYNRYLEKQRMVTIKDGAGNKVQQRLTDAELGPTLVAQFARIREQIANSGFGEAPISPIDYLHSELRKAGYKTDEITGRTLKISYESGTPILTSRTANIRQRVNAVRSFNNGDTDVIILNQAGSTGLSLHAAAKFKDKRKRHMIIVQAEKNIDTHMQMLGRVHRTGQVVAPAYSQMMADIPAEMRPASVLMKKMASLNANTTASRKSSVTAEGVVDFMNDYGGQVVQEYLRDNPDVLEAMGGSKVLSLKEDSADGGEEDIRKFTGYIPILPIKQQEEIYKDLIDRYNELLERENSMGTNKLEAKAVDLDAKTLSTQAITEDRGDPSVFATPASMERVDVKRTVKPYSADEVRNMVKERWNGQKPTEIAQAQLNELTEKGRKFIEERVAKMQAGGAEPVRMDAQKSIMEMVLSRAQTILRTHRIGDQISVKDSEGMTLYGVITDIAGSGRTANPAAGSAWKMQIALANGDSKTLNLNFSQIGSRYTVEQAGRIDWYNPETQSSERVLVIDIFDKGATVMREKRWMVTGNILAGFAKYPGQIISYTKQDGTVAQGVLMNRQFDFEKEQKNAPVTLKTADDAMKFLAEGGYGASLGNPDGTIKVAIRGGDFVFTTPSSKREGGSYFLDRQLTDAIGNDFYKRGSVMQANAYSTEQTKQAIAYLMGEREEKMVALTNVDKARDMFGKKVDAPAMSRSGTTGGMTVAQVKQVADAITERWNNAPSVVVVSDMNDPAIPVPVRAEYSRQNSQGASGSIDGFFVGGKVYVVAGAVRDTADVVRVVYHEALGHYGLRGVFGTQLDGILSKVIELNRSQVEAKAKEYGLNPNNKEDMKQAAEEVLADMAQTNPSLSLVQRAIAVIRSLLRKLPGLNGIRMSNSEIIRNYILPARGWVQRSKSAGSQGDVAFSRMDQTGTPAFKKWFGDSKVVDENGKPLVVYHGTMSSFNEFGEDIDVQRAKKMGLPNDGMFYFAKSPDVAGTYTNNVVAGANVMPVYVSLKNPVTIDAKGQRYDAGRDNRFGGNAGLTMEAVYKALENGNDGVIIRNVRDDVNGGGDPTDVFIAFNREQIKSAIGNNGNFDASNPDIRFSRQGDEFSDTQRKTQRNALNFWGNQKKDSLKTFGLYDKTLSTQFNKALKDPHYGKVFGYANAMQNEISLTSIRPAELAPQVLPRIDNVLAAAKTMVMGKRGNKELNKAANAIFAGTLAGDTVLEGQVWTEEELRNRFGMNDEGVNLYQQSRAAIDASLDEVAAAEAYAIAQGFVPKGMRRQIINDPAGARKLIVDELAKQMKMLKAAIRVAKKNGEDRKVSSLEAALELHQATDRSVGKVFNQARQLKEAGYAPLMRFGKFTVLVQAIDPDTGNVLRDQNGESITEFYSQYETEAEAQEAKARMEKQFAGQDVRITAGTKSQKGHELYAGISPETLALFAEAVGADEATKKYYQLALSERSALKRRLQRKNTAGYDNDMPRVLSNFITSNGRHAAQRYYLRDLNNAIKFIPKEKGDVLDEAIKLKDFLRTTGDPAAPVSAAMFAWFLGGSVASAAVNLTQPILMTAPYLSQFGITTATAAMGKALPIALGKKPVNDPALRDALKRASQEGIVDAQEIFHLYSVGAQGVASGAVSALSKIPLAGKFVKAGSEDARARINGFLTIWGSMFAAAEGFNRRLTFVAAWEVAKSNGEKNPYAFAVRAVNVTQGIYNKVNRPNWARGSVGRVILTFKQFSLMYLEMLGRLWKKGGPEGKRAALIMLATLMLAAGDEGLPFSQDMDDLIDTIGQMFGMDTNMKRAKRRMAYQILGKTLGDLFLYGISSQLPLDFSGRLGLGNLIPGSGILKPSNESGRSREVAEIFGPAAGMATQIGDAYDAAVEGNVGKAGQNLAPTAVKNAMAAAEMAKKGYSTDAKGRKVVESTPTDIAVKAIGFNPTVNAETTRKSMPAYQDIALQKKTESSIVEQWARGSADNDASLVDKAAKRLESWNKSNPDTLIVITPDQIRSRARQMLTDKDTRLIKGAPREMRGRVGLDIIK